MAVNYTLREAVLILSEGTKLEEIQDIGKRFPLLSYSATKIIAKAGKELNELMAHMPDNLTANKVNRSMKEAIGEAEDNEEVEEVEETDEVESEKPVEVKAKSTKAKETKETETTEYSKMKNADLLALLEKRGIKNKVEAWNKKGYIATLEAHDANGGEEETEVEEAEVEVEETENKYAGMTAPALFKECKARKIKAAPKKPAKFYIELLEEDDAKNAEVEETEEDDDWDDDWEDVKEEEPATEDDEDDEDDDWDI